MSFAQASERWLIALGALHTESIGNKEHDELGGAQSVIEFWPKHLDTLKREFGLDSEQAVLSYLSQMRPTPFESLAHHGTFADLSNVDLEKRGWAAWDAHRASVIAGLAHLAGMDRGKLLAALNSVGGRVRVAYDSWAEYGWHVLLGQAASTGEWDETLERAYHVLVDNRQSPYAQVPWTSYSPKPMGPSAVQLHAIVRCTRCMSWVAIDRVAESLSCPSCFATVALPQSVWDNVRRDADEARPWPLGFVDSHHHYEDDAELNVDIENAWPRCTCGVPLSATTLMGRKNKDFVECVQCARKWNVRTVFDDGAIAVGEREPIDARKNANDQRVMLACEACGGPLRVQETRDIACGYCRHTTRVPDELWARLFPTRLDAVITLVFDEG
jgi:Protein of unknown function (DUF1266)